MTTKTKKKAVDFGQYQSDPVGYGEEVLKATYSLDAQQVLRSIRDHQITLVPAGFLVGKTHAAISAALWFRDCMSAPTKVGLISASSTLRKLLEEAINKLDVSGASSPHRVIAHWHAGQDKHMLAGWPVPNSLYIIDEGTYVPWGVYEYILDQVSLTNGRLLVTGVRTHKGCMDYLAKDPRSNVVPMPVFNHPNVVSGEAVVPGVIERTGVVGLIKEMSDPLPSDETPNRLFLDFKVPEFFGELAGWRRARSYRLIYMLFGEEYPPEPEEG